MRQLPPVYPAIRDGHRNRTIRIGRQNKIFHEPVNKLKKPLFKHE